MLPPTAAGTCPTEWTLALTNTAQTPVKPFHWKHKWFHRSLARAVFSDATSRSLIVTRIVSLGLACIRHSITDFLFLFPGKRTADSIAGRRRAQSVAVFGARVTRIIVIITSVELNNIELPTSPHDTTVLRHVKFLCHRIRLPRTATAAQLQNHRRSVKHVKVRDFVLSPPASRRTTKY